MGCFLENTSSTRSVKLALGRGEKDTIELLLHCLSHAYIETEHEVAETIPAVMAFKSIHVFRDRFRDSPACKEILNWTPELLAEKLVKSGFVREAYFQKRGDLIIFEVKGCRYAPYIHPYINREYLCPYVTMSLLVLGEKYGDVKLAGKLPEKTDSGIRAEFKIEERK